MEFKELYKFTIDQEKDIVKEHTSEKTKKLGKKPRLRKPLRKKYLSRLG